MRRCRWCLTLAALSGCSGFVDVETWDQLPELSDLDVAQVTPAEPAIVWELRLGFSEDRYDLVTGVGLDAKDTLAPDVRLAFDSVSVLPPGAFTACPPGLCFYYIASLDDDGPHVWSSTAEVVAFLAPVDAPAEAAIVARLSGYHWSVHDKAQGAMRSTAEGFELVVLQIVSFCDPVQVNRFHILVTTAGEVHELAEDVVSKESGVCI